MSAQLNSQVLFFHPTITKKLNTKPFTKSVFIRSKIRKFSYGSDNCYLVKLYILVFKFSVCVFVLELPLQFCLPLTGLVPQNCSTGYYAVQESLRPDLHLRVVLR